MIQTLMKKKNITKYRLSKNSGIPYTTLTDICSGKTQLEKCSAETIYKLSKELGVSMETILEPCFEKRCSFDLFKSNVCHRLKSMGDVNFVIDTLETNDIRIYYNKRWYAECFYLLAMLDYVSRENQIPICSEYNDLRSQKLKETVYPSGILAMAAVGNNSVIEESRRNATPEFLRFNIVENEVRNVI